MADFLDTSFDQPKTAKVPLNALFFGPHEHFLVPLRNAKTKILFRIHFFAIFDFRPGGSNGEPGGCNGRRLQKKVDKKFFQINTNNFPSFGHAWNGTWGRPELAAWRLFFPYFRFSACSSYVGQVGSHEPGTPTTEKTPDFASLREVPRTNPKSELKNIKYWRC